MMTSGPCPAARVLVPRSMISNEAAGSPPLGLVTVRPATLPCRSPAAEVNEPVFMSSLPRLATEPVSSFLVAVP